MDEIIVTGKNMRREEAEAIFMLKDKNPEEWEIFINFIKRRLKYEERQCIDCNKEQVEIHQGKARELRYLAEIYERAQKVHDVAQNN